MNRKFCVIWSFLLLYCSVFLPGLLTIFYWNVDRSLLPDELWQQRLEILLKPEYVFFQPLPSMRELYEAFRASSISSHETYAVVVSIILIHAFILKRTIYVQRNLNTQSLNRLTLVQTSITFGMWGSVGIYAFLKSGSFFAFLHYPGYLICFYYFGQYGLGSETLHTLLSGSRDDLRMLGDWGTDSNDRITHRKTHEII